MFPFIELVDNQGNTHQSSLAIVCFGLVLIGLRLRANRFGGDVAIILFHVAIGLGWGK